MEKRIKIEAKALVAVAGIKKDVQVTQVKNCIYLSTIASAVLLVGFAQANESKQMENSNFGCVNLADENKNNNNLEIMPVRQQLRNAVEAIRKNLDSSKKKDNNYLTWIDVADLENLIGAVNNYLTLVEAPHLCRLHEKLTQLHANRENQHVTSCDLNECKLILDQISNVISLQPEMNIQFGPYVVAE